MYKSLNAIVHAHVDRHMFKAESSELEKVLFFTNFKIFLIFRGTIGQNDHLFPNALIKSIFAL